MRDFQKSLARAVSDKNIQVDEAAELSVHIKGLFDSAIKFKSQPNRFHRLTGAALDTFSNWARAISGDPVAIAYSMSKELVKKIRDTIRRNTTPRHVPARVIAVDDIPYTINMKKVEKAVVNVIHNEPVPNLDALANPESLEYYRDIEELKT